MSTEEELTATGRTVEEYVESRKKLAALLTEATRMGNTLTTIGQFLRSASPHAEISPNIWQQLVHLPTEGRVKTLVDDLNQEIVRKRKLHQSLKSLGLEPKD
jgi:hypothetical protein